MLATLAVGQASAADQAQWLELRRLSNEALKERVDPASNSTAQERVIVNLNLAERALNESVEAAASFLKDAQLNIEPGSDNAKFALAVRCQLEHRQGMEGAVQTCSTLAEESQVSTNPLVRSYTLGTLAYFYFRQGNHDRSLTEGQRALALAEQVGDLRLLASTNNLIGVYYSTRLLPRMSIPHLEKAWEYANEASEPQLKILVQLNLAYSYTYLGRGADALRLLTDPGEQPVVSLYPTRHLIHQSYIAHARIAAGKLEGAEEQLQGVISEVSDNVLPDGMTFAYISLGLLQLATDRPEEALVNFDRVLAISKRTLYSGLDHPRIRLLVVPYARGLRMAGKIEESRRLMEATINHVSQDEPNQLLVDAFMDLGLSLEAMHNVREAAEARANAARIEQELWDASFQYQIARLNASLEVDQAKIELQRAQQQQSVLQEMANREKKLRFQSWIMGAMMIAVVLLFQSRRLQKRLADSQRLASEDLEDLVKTRTQELEDEMAERLRVEVKERALLAKLAEQEKLHALGQLTAGVAHDFNNLMAIVTLSADHLKSSGSVSVQSTDAEVLENISAAADAGSKITNGLLAYVRKQPLKPQVLDLKAFLEQSLPLFKKALGAGFELKEDLHPCVVEVDRAQLTTSLLNLIINAKEAMGTQGMVYLILRGVDNRAEISVRDNGPGMSEETQRKSVEPFYTTKDSGEGTGLGLSIVYGFARQSGGDMSIHSRPGEGTMVTLSLPKAGTNIASAATAAQQTKSDLAVGTQVLVVEDRELLRNMLERTLTEFGMQVWTAENGESALSLIESRGLPDLLVSDIVMPGSLDGISLANTLRQQQPSLAVLLISGYSEALDSRFRFLRKPFSMTELEQAIHSAMDEVRDSWSLAH
ncbi:MAG: ATP-binding protein [Lysobacterales bacterium]